MFSEKKKNLPLISCLMKKTTYVSKEHDLSNIALEFQTRVLRQENKQKECRLQMIQNYILVDYIAQYIEIQHNAIIIINFQVSIRSSQPNMAFKIFLQIRCLGLNF